MTGISTFWGDIFSQVCYYGRVLHNSDDFILCYDIICGRYKFVHHQGASCCQCVWIYKKVQSGQMYGKIRANFALCVNRAAPTESTFHKLEKEIFLTSSMLDVK
jgi:hypothetical protein